MTPTKYLNFDLLIEREGDAYRASASSLSAGEFKEISFDFPFSDEELEKYLRLLGRPSDGANDETFNRAAKDFGNRLFESVFRDDVLVCLSVSLYDARERDLGLRIRLRFADETSDDPNLSGAQKEVLKLFALPWEYLYTPSLSFPARVSRTPVVRYMQLDEPVRALTVTGPLRILVMISSPDDYPPLNVDKEWTNLNKAFAGLPNKDAVQLTKLDDASETSLARALRTNAYHVFHFIGHGGYDAETGDGFLILEQGDDTRSDETSPVLGRRVNGERLADILRNRLPRLAILNACDAGRGSLMQPFGGTAQSLVRAGIPAVIAMQFEITDDAAVNFAREFYRALADYSPVDEALSYARIAMGDAEWGTPALYMRSDDGCIFTKWHEPPPPPPPPPPRDPTTLPPPEMYYQMMVADIQQGKLVPFLGARANLCGRKPGDWEQGPYPPSDGELADCLSKVRRPPFETRELVQVSQYIALESAAFLNSKLHTVLAQRFETSPLHRFLARLPSVLREGSKPGRKPRYQLIVTTNYDDTLEQAFDDAHEPFDLVSYIATGDYRGKFYHKAPGGPPVIIERPESYELLPDEHTVILKLYGAVDREDPQQDSYVITEDNYVDHLSSGFIDQIPATLRERLKSANTSFAFLGYRLRGWNLRIIFRRIWEDQGPRSMSWVIRPDPQIDDIEFWSSRNVKILNASLDDFVAEMNTRLS